MTSPTASAQRDPALEAHLTEHLGAGLFARSVHAYASVASTMDIAEELAAGGLPEGTLVWAARQARGRGRFGRAWESPEGGIYLSLILQPTRARAEVPQLSLVAGLSVAEAIHDLTGLFPRIRWPNDLLLEVRKVGGILVEMASTAAIVGIGINVTTDPCRLPPNATSLAACTAAACDPYRLTGALCQRLQAWYDAWTVRGFAPLREALRPWLAFLGSVVRLTTGDSVVEGQAVDLDEVGRLLVRLDAGVVRAFAMAEVTRLR